jgi:uncharacterized protein YukE
VPALRPTDDYHTGEDVSEHVPGGDLTVGESQITTLLTQLDDNLEYLRQNHTQLGGILDSVTAAWRGAAGSQFSLGQTDANELLNRLIRALANLRELVQMSRDGFTGQEQEIAANLRSVHSQLEGVPSPWGADV